MFKKIFLGFVLFLFIFIILFYYLVSNLNYELTEDIYQTDHYTNLEDIPDVIIDTFIAVEDKRFYSHSGIDVIGLVRITFLAIKDGEFSQGASTITQQLARTAFLNQEQTVSRKLKEMMIALSLEKNYSKDKILESYINIVYYGKGAYGIHDAAKTFFNKQLDELTLDEIAYLVGIVKGPSLYPEDDTLGENRKQVVLSIMEREGIIEQYKK